MRIKPLYYKFTFSVFFLFLLTLNVSASESNSDVFREALVTGDVKKVKELIDKEPELVHKRFENEWTPLHFAAARGDVDCLKVLLDRRAIVDAKDKNGCSPLLIASSKNRLRVVRILIKKGAGVNLTDKHGVTPLHQAVLRQNKEVFNILLQAGADISIKTANGYTPLDFANSAKDRYFHWKMLENKGLSRLTESELLNYLMHSLANRDEKQVDRLLKFGVDLNSLNSKGRAIIHIAAKHGDIEMTKLLLKKGADVNLKDAGGSTPLYWGIWWGNQEYVEYLISKGAVLECSSDQFYEAFERNITYDGEFFRAFFEYIDDKQVANIDSHRLLLIAYRAQNMNVVKEIVKRIEIDPQSKYSDALLFTSAGAGDFEIVRTLLKTEGNLNKKDDRGCSLVEAAIEGGNIDVVKLFVERGAPFDEKNKMGYTPLWCAVLSEKFDIADYLISKGADINSTNNIGMLLSEVILAPTHSPVPFDVRKRYMKYIFSRGGFISPGYLGEMIQHRYWVHVFFCITHCYYYSVPMILVILTVIIMVVFKKVKNSTS